MEITDVSATKVSNESWGEFIEFSLVTIISKYDEYRNVDGENPPSPEGGSIPLPGEPGLSTQLNHDALERFAVA